MIGQEAYNHPELTPLFLKFNTDVDLAMGLGTMLPSWLRWVAWFQINADYNKFRKIIKPIIKKRRGSPAVQKDGLMDFMPFILDLIEDDNRASGKSTLQFPLSVRVRWPMTHSFVSKTLS
jgi:hypothetical protein